MLPGQIRIECIPSQFHLPDSSQGRVIRHILLLNKKKLTRINVDLRKCATPAAEEVSKRGPVWTTIPTEEEGNPSSQVMTDTPETSSIVYFIGAAAAGCRPIDFATEEKRLNIKNNFT